MWAFYTCFWLESDGEMRVVVGVGVCEECGWWGMVMIGRSRYHANYTAGKDFFEIFC